MKLELKNINKKIGNKTILDDVNLALESGKAYGFVGKNGSGKTMLFRLIAGIIKTSSGEMILDGNKLTKELCNYLSIGLMIENIGLYPEFTGYSNLSNLAKIRKKIGKNEIIEAINRVGLDPDDKRTVRKYSLGMKQRIVLAQAIMEKPDILIMDEPTNGIDEDGINLFYQIIKEEKDRGAIVLISSHNSEEINDLCDEIYSAAAGKFAKVL
jgi:ABC-2 type transport system ATP-binding protein